MFSNGELFRMRKSIYKTFSQLVDKDLDALADELNKATAYWQMWEIVAKYSKILYYDYGVKYKGYYGNESEV
jgi:hypothetical protein